MELNCEAIQWQPPPATIPTESCSNIDVSLPVVRAGEWASLCPKAEVKVVEKPVFIQMSGTDVGSHPNCETLEKPGSYPLKIWQCEGDCEDDEDKVPSTIMIEICKRPP